MDQEKIILIGQRTSEYAGRKTTDRPFLSTKTAIIDISKGKRPEPWMIEYGFKNLSKWEVILQFREYSEIAADYLDGEEAKRARGQILDLRQPVFDNRIMFLKKTPRAEKFFKTFAEEATRNDPRVALLIAAWAVKPSLHVLAKGGWK